jgi:hypothetical protein
MIILLVFANKLKRLYNTTKKTALAKGQFLTQLIKNELANISVCISAEAQINT